MGGIRDGLLSPWRAVPMLGVTQILGWGAIYYTPVLVAPLIAADRGWSLFFTMAGFSLGLLTAGLVAPRIGALIDRHGGHCVMPVGSLLGAAGLAAVTVAAHPAAYLAAWALLGIAISCSLYDAAFASIARIFGIAARRPITLLTLAGALASTVSWPATHLLNGAIGWQGTYLVYAAVLAGVAAPLHLLLPRTRAATAAAPAAGDAPKPAVLPPGGRMFWLMAAAFAAYAFVPAGLLAHLLAMFQRMGIEAGTAVAIGAMFGPCQMVVRLCEFIFARNIHPLVMVRFAVALLLLGFLVLAAFGLSAPVAALFVVLFGLSNGLITICRGAVPLVMFGAHGYGRLIGRIAAPAMVVQSAAPMVVAFVAERASDATAFALAAVAASIALACFLALRRPAATAV